jgi:NAD(P)-dependent dehydrogenase (short-subunit alcohol dehydrogenase family)
VRRGKKGDFMYESTVFDLTGKKALVTGGASGIGRACAIGMAKAGADVAIVDLDEGMARETVEMIKSLGRESIFVFCDVSDVSQVDAMMDNVVKSFGRLDIGFNNAGIAVHKPGLSIEDSALFSWEKTLAVNLTGTFYCCRAEARYMIPWRYGKIINTSSMCGTIVAQLRVMDTGMLPYCVSKAGVKHLTKALAAEWAQYNICVNCISPGYVTTPLIAGKPAEAVDFDNLATPMRRPAQPEEMVGGVLYLSSDASSFCTGCDLIVDGGYTVW